MEEATLHYLAVLFAQRPAPFRASAPYRSLTIEVVDVLDATAARCIQAVLPDQATQIIEHLNQGLALPARGEATEHGRI